MLIPQHMFHPSATRILSIVCGYSAPQQRRQLIVALRAFIDDSQKGNFLVMGGYIAPAEEWAKFSIEWDERLNEVGIPEFRMSERVHAPVEINGYFYRLIEKYASAAICVAVPIDLLNKVVDELRLPKIMRNPYHFAYKIVVNCCAQYQNDLGLTDPIDFVFDEQDGAQNLVLGAWEAYKDSIPPETLALTGAPPHFEKSHKMKPLQAADILAYWYRARLNKGGTFGDRSSPFPWPLKKAMPRLLIELDEDSILANLLQLRAKLDLFHSIPVTVTFTLNGRPI